MLDADDRYAVRDQQALTDLIATFARIDSVNPALDASRSGEGRLADAVEGWAQRHGLDTQRLEGTPGRPSVIARARPGGGDGFRLVLNAHLDTVGVQGMEAPFEPRVAGGRMMARGAMDMKASLAASLRAAAWAAAQPDLRGEVIVAAVADEEHDSIGTREALEAVCRADLAIVTEPTDLALHVAHRGFAVADVILTGRASHTSQPERGVNAVTHLGRLLARIEAKDADLRARTPHPHLGHGSFQAVLASGGHELFTTPVAAHATVERRTVPGEASADTIREDLDAILAELQAEDERMRAEVRVLVAREAFACDPDDPAVARVARAVAAQTGREPNRSGAPYWTDAALVAASGTPTVLFGPVGGDIHGPGEWVDLASVATVEAVLRRLIAEALAVA